MQRPPESENGAPARGAAISLNHHNQADNTATVAELQARRIARLYFVSMAVASTIARLAYSVAR